MDLGDALFHAVRVAAPLPERIGATVVLRTHGGAAWTVRVSGGRPALAAGGDAQADTTITGDEVTLRRIAEGAESGVAAFLDGRITVRGNLALSLRLDGMWGGDEPGPDHVRAGDVTAGGVRTFFIEAGQGRPVVLLHGLGATNASMLPTLRELARDHRVIAPDLPGFGDSAKPLRSLHAGFYARWFAELCTELGLERPHVIGNSMGGRIAVEAGLRYPESVDRLVLLAPSPAFLKGRDWVRLVRLLRPELALVPLPVPHRAVVQGIRRMFSQPSRLEDAWYDAAADEFLRVFSRPRGRISFFSAMRQIYLEEPHGKPGGFWSRLPVLDRPALFVWGRRDRLVPARFAAHVERALPAATSVVLDDCGHVPHYELPETTHALVRRFLAEAA
jgi:pimeloyl-ACP methyl ester carboxylesterase